MTDNVSRPAPSLREWEGRLPLVCPICGQPPLGRERSEIPDVAIRSHLIFRHDRLAAEITPTLPYSHSRRAYVVTETPKLRVIWSDWPYEVETLNAGRYRLRREE